MRGGRFLTAGLGLLLLALPGSVRGVCSGGGGGAPPVPVPNPGGGYGVPTIDPRYSVGDFDTWWRINRDDLLLTLKEKPPEALSEYERKTAPPDKLESLLALVGYEGDFCTIVKEVGVQRIRKFPKVVPALVAILKDAKAVAAQRAWAAYALGDLKAKAAIGDLQSELKSSEKDIRGFCVLSLSKMEDPTASAAILPVAQDTHEDEEVRGMAILGLAPCQAPEVRKALAELAATAASVPVRRAALMALGVKPTAPDRSVLQAQVKDRDPFIRSAAAIGLGLAGDVKSLVESLSPAQEKATIVRCCAALGLGIAPSPEASEALCVAEEQDKDFSVRGCAALALGRCPDAKAFEALSKAFHNRQYSYISNYAAIGLGLTGRKEAAPLLAEGMEAKAFDRVTSSASALAILGRPEATEPLLKALDNKSHAIVREYAAVALGRLRVASTLPRLEACMEDPTVEVRHATALALGVFGEPSACPFLEKGMADKIEIVRVLSSLSYDLLVQDDTKPLTMGDRFRADPRSATSRKVGSKELTRLLNSYMPASYKLPISP